MEACRHLTRQISDQIVAIREMYGLSQVDLARLLGWGEATISRYESKAIQDEAYDNMLRIIRENPKVTLELFQKNASKFSPAKRVSNLFKVKLMKMLWYADSVFFKANDRTITRLVYCHDEMGALPVGHYNFA